MAAGAPGEFTFASSDDAAPAALFEDLRGGELEIELEHDRFSS
jgi:hypothetical protein